MIQVSTPILLIAHRRPRETERVARSILSANPACVYVAIDGPRPDVPDDASNCARVEELLRTAGWPGEVEFWINAENLGARRMVPSAIEWALGRDNELIILEDDCIPHRTFFTFCDELLGRFRNDPRVMMVAGTNPAPWRRGPSYRFSMYGASWGWATWASAWRHFWRARALLSDQATDLKALVETAWRGHDERDLWASIYHRLRDGGSTWSRTGWDYEWLLARAMNQGLAVMPRVNLVTNIGFGESATNTLTRSAHPIGRRRRHRMNFPLVEPARQEPDPHLDAVLRAGHLGFEIPGLRGKARRFAAKVRGKIDATLKRNEFSH